MAVPEDATDVFGIDTRSATNPSFTSNFVTDFALARDVSQTWEWVAAQRLTQGKIFEGTHDTDAEYSSSSFNFDYQNGYGNLGSANSNYYGWMWKRAPSFCDVVAYTGNNQLRTINHNLGAVPEMMWLKRRDAADIWTVYHSALGAGKRLKLHQSTAAEDDLSSFNNTAPTDSVFTINANVNQLNASGSTYIAYLFASLDGVSKVGSYTGNGSTQNIDCGFSSGARFVLIKISSGGGNWNLWDSERGIVAGNDPYLRLNTTDAEVTAYDLIDPYSSGFTVSANAVNSSGQTYIYYAIA
jgi:hypothetical protein